MITMEILLEGPSQDSTEAVGREGTRKHGDITEAAFKRFIYII
jgi:hypothetical protein